ncbi:MAG: class II fructose-bisphosphatase [Firmicutes bacterium]|jgi:fructose-1,6-bisphosphatase II|uniref:Fructose-1,6-bisphosphatase n=1 Tax=Sulfobacillus benefaciens TaxID=453960 RepID=A0A2T2WSF5_9FIRM|nr:class II fructose-bisphosphatase [Bacillota bacterium]MCL5015480.1 class II fructose-bisphosphatase [Bacillota bacterium]PSR25170.1 MAG: fructose-bisphosphatase class II [Sulfobacillus benefaciens]
MERELALEFVRVTEAAALASGRLIGHGDKNGADQLAVDAMRSVLDSVHIRGTVVIGEGEMDEAPMLYIGEKVGAGDGDEVDIAVDPLEGTNLVAKGMPGAVAVMAVAPKGHLLHAPDMYMEKIVAGPEGVGVIHLDAPIEHNLRELAKASHREVSELTVVLLDRERHEEQIRRIREAGARVKLISDGDVLPAIQACLSHSGVDMLLGSGGAPEGVIAAAAVKSLGGTMQGRLIPEDDAQQERLQQMSVMDTRHILDLDDLVQGDDAFCVATGITGGDFLKGVHYGKGYATTYSVVMRSKTGTVRFIKTQHRMVRMAAK